MNKKNIMKSLFSIAILVSFFSPMAASAEEMRDADVVRMDVQIMKVLHFRDYKQIQSTTTLYM